MQKMLKKSIVTVLVGAMFGSMLVGCSKTETADDAVETNQETTEQEVSEQEVSEVYTLRVGIQQASTHSYTLAMEKFKEELEEKTNGQISVELYPDSVLGTEAEMQEMISTGDLEMAPTTFLVQYDPVYAMLEMPYVFDDFDHVKRFVNSEACTELKERLVESKNIRILTYFGNGFRQITNNKQPINHPEDLKGLSLRTPENQAQIETFKALGSVVTPLPFTELYSSLQQGVVDGQENPIQQIYNSKFYEVQKYMAMTNHMFNPGAVIINESFYQSLPEDLRAALLECIVEAGEWQMDFVENSDEENLQKIIDAGVEVTYPDMEEFKEATAPVLEIFYEEYGDDARNLIQAINDCR
jgi:tripartite ATP-independent transporter DctP family solute receptor